MNDDVIPLNEIGKIGTVEVYSQAYVDKQQKRIEELEKENTELKEMYVKECEDVTYVVTNYNKQLTKAKELINKMLYEYQYLCLIKKETIAGAEQFLKEIEK